MLTSHLTNEYQRHYGMGYNGILDGGNLSANYGKIDGTTISWYKLNASGQQLGAQLQLNYESVEYMYIAIG